MKTMFTMIAVTLTHFSSFSTGTEIQDLLSDYMKVKDALVNDDAVKASQEAAVLLVKVDSMPPVSQKKELAEAVNTIASTTKIEKQRQAFATLSDIVWELLKSAPDLTQTVYQHYCPMKKVYWLSYEMAVKNPYYGKQMLTCGKVTDKILN